MMEKLEPARTLDWEQPLSKAIGELKRNEACVIITKNGGYKGIVDDRMVEHVTVDPTQVKVGSVAFKAPIVNVDDDVRNICKYFFAGPFKSLPVRKGEEIIGVIMRRRVLEALVETTILRGRVAEYMSSPVVTVDEDATIAQVRATMRKNHVRRIVITKGDRLRGILTTYDIKMVTSKPKDKLPFVVEKVSMEEYPVKSIMKSAEEVVTITPERSLKEAARKMIENDVASLVVLKGGKPIGMLSARDILEATLETEKPPIHISGLDYSDRMEVDVIRADCEAELEKINRSMKIDYLALHFKRYKNKYSVHARLKTSRHGIIVASNHGFDFRGTVHGLMKELRKMVMHKAKKDPMKRKGRKPYRGGF